MAVTMLEQLYGHVTAMTRETEGSTVTVAASIADTVITVASTGDFDGDNGGQVVLGPADDIYDYVTVDEDASTITLTTGLLTALEVDDPVDIWDPEVGDRIVEYVALVLLDEQDPGDEPVEVTVQHGLVNMLAESVRGGIAEAVTLVRDGFDDLMIWQIDGKLAIDVALEAAVSDFDASMAELDADLTELNTVTLPQVQADLADAVSDISGIQGLFPITSTSISDSAIITPKIAANAITGDKIVANTITGAKIVGLSITGDKIAANTISGDKIVANSISSDKIAANSITAGKIAAGAINGMDASLNDVLVSSLISISGNISSQAQLRAAAGVFDDALSGGGTTAAQVNANGRFIRDTSAAKHKENVRPIDVDLDVVAAVEPVLYEWIDKDLRGDQIEPGVIADQALAACAGRFVTFDGDNEVNGFRYDRFGAVGVILAAREIKQLRDLISNAITRIETLETP